MSLSEETKQRIIAASNTSKDKLVTNMRDYSKTPFIQKKVEMAKKILTAYPPKNDIQ